MDSPLILVTGATGYIASRLIPRLLDAGYRVRCLAREPRRLQDRSWFRKVEVIQGDILMPSILHAALEGVHTAYYLVHNMSYGHGYTALELDSARRFAFTAEEAHVQHIIYLGGLADPEQEIAPHMRSRIETGNVLREGSVPVTEFRAGVIIGSGSISFEMIRFITELFPVVLGPSWLKNKSQPIAIQNVIDYLLAALTNPSRRGGVFEIGGPQVIRYADLMLGYARIRGIRRRIFLLSGIPLWFMARGVDLMTPVPYPIAYALIGGLSADSVVRRTEALEKFPEVKLIDFESATKEALEKTHPKHVERVWKTGASAVSLKHEGHFIDHREVVTHVEPEKVFRAVMHLVEARGWIVETANQQVIASVQDQVAGKRWVEWRISQAENVTYIAQAVFFSPRGLPGFLYWYLLYPFHLIDYRGLIRSIVEQSESR